MRHQGSAERCKRAKKGPQTRRRRLMTRPAKEGHGRPQTSRTATCTKVRSRDSKNLLPIVSAKGSLAIGNTTWSFFRRLPYLYLYCSFRQSSWRLSLIRGSGSLDLWSLGQTCTISLLSPKCGSWCLTRRWCEMHARALVLTWVRSLTENAFSSQ